MSKQDLTELNLMAAALQMAIAYDGDVKAVANAIEAWSHADETGRREIFRAWRNA